MAARDDSRVVHLERYIERLLGAHKRVSSELNEAAQLTDWARLEAELATQLSADETRALIEVGVLTDHDLLRAHRLSVVARGRQLAAIEHLLELAKARLDQLMSPE